jgi:hypothetical protein
MAEASAQIFLSPQGFESYEPRIRMLSEEQFCRDSHQVGAWRSLVARFVRDKKGPFSSDLLKPSCLFNALMLRALRRRQSLSSRLRSSLFRGQPDKMTG